LDKTSGVKPETPEKDSDIEQESKNCHSRHEFTDKLKRPKTPENFTKIIYDWPWATSCVPKSILWDDGSKEWSGRLCNAS